MTRAGFITAGAFATLCWAGGAYCQAPANPPAAALPPPLTLPAPTPAQQAYINQLEACNTQFRAQRIPKSQYHTFTRACFTANGITAAPPLPPPPPPPAR